MEKNPIVRAGHIETYKSVQTSINESIVEEHAQKIEQKFKRILADKSRTNFWKEKRTLTKNPTLDLESLGIKDENGDRIFAPSHVKEATAKYYETLYNPSISNSIPK